MNTKKILVLIIAFLMVVISCFGCSSKHEYVAPSQSHEEVIEEQPLKELRVAVQAAYLSFPVQYAIDTGIDKKYGLKIIPVFYQSGADQNLDIDTGKYDVSTTGAAFLYPVSEGKAFIVAENIKSDGGDALFVRKNSDILKVKTFNPTYPDIFGSSDTVKGKSLLLTEETTSQLLAYRWLEAVGVKTKNVTVTNKTFKDCYDSFLNGEGDIVALPGPYSFFSKENEWFQVATMEDLGFSKYEVIIATAEAYHNRPDDIEAFINVILDANYELETNYGLKIEYCRKWYNDINNLDNTIENIREECKLKPLVTRNNYKIESYGNFETQYAEFMVSIDALNVKKLSVVQQSIDRDMFKRALGQ